MLRICCLVTLCAMALCTMALQEDSSSTPWPYHQMHPPVDETDDRTPLYFALVFTFPNSSYVSIGSLPGIQIALDYINSEPSILPGYSLHYTFTNSQCDRQRALSTYFHQMKTPPIKVGWIGSGCSPATEPTAELSYFYNITQLSCVSSSPALHDRARFRYYFQTPTPDTLTAYGFFGVIKHYGWKKVRLVAQDENVFTESMEILKQMFDEIGVEYTEVRFRSEEKFTSVHAFDPETRIYVLGMYTAHARDAFCVAYRNGYYYPKYTIFTFGWYDTFWWEINGQVTDCTAEERARALHYSIAAISSDFLRRQEDYTAEPNITLSTFDSLYYQYVNKSYNSKNHLEEYNDYIFPYAYHCHEGMLAFAYALNATIMDLAEDEELNRRAAEESDLPEGETFTMANFTYANAAVVARMFEHLQNTAFPGITGEDVKFNDEGTREIYKVSVLQYQVLNENEEVRAQVGVVFIDDNSTFEPHDNSFMFPDGVPIDGIPIEEVVTVSLGLTVVYIILATAGLALTIFCLLFTVFFRKKRLIRMSSPNLNYIIGLGAIVLYFNVIVLVIPTTDEDFSAVLCNLHPWLISLGYSLCYGIIIIKMIRVWILFNRPLGFKTSLFKDYLMALFVLCLAIIDIVILLTYTVTEAVRDNLGVKLITSRELPEETFGATAEFHKYFLYVCESDGQVILYAVLFGYKGVLQVLALLLAFRTRNVKVKGLDDSVYIAASVYVTSIVLTVIIVSTYTLRDFVNAYPAVVGMGLLLGTSAILGLVFIPRMFGLYKDPKGEGVSTFVTAAQQEEVKQPDKPKSGSDMDNEMKKLRLRVIELEEVVKKHAPDALLYSTDGDVAVNEKCSAT